MTRIAPDIPELEHVPDAVRSIIYMRAFANAIRSPLTWLIGAVVLAIGVGIAETLGRAVLDDLGSILTRMGPGYQYTRLQNDDLCSIDALKKHDVVFLTCADQYVRDFRAARPLRDSLPVIRRSFETRAGCRFRKTRLRAFPAALRSRGPHPRR